MTETPHIQRAAPIVGYSETAFDPVVAGVVPRSWHELECGHGTDNGYVSSPSFKGPGPWHWCDVCRAHRRSLRWLERHPDGGRVPGWAGRAK